MELNTAPFEQLVLFLSRLTDFLSALIKWRKTNFANYNIDAEYGVLFLYHVWWQIVTRGVILKCVLEECKISTWHRWNNVFSCRFHGHSKRTGRTMNKVFSTATNQRHDNSSCAKGFPKSSIRNMAKLRIVAVNLRAKYLTQTESIWSVKISN